MSATVTITEGNLAEDRPHLIAIVAGDPAVEREGSDFDMLEAILGPAIAVGAGSRRFHIRHVDTRRRVALEVKVWDGPNVVLAAARCAVCQLRCVMGREVRLEGWLAIEAADCSSEPEHEEPPEGYSEPDEP